MIETGSHELSDYTIERFAKISECGAYRYRLERRFVPRADILGNKPPELGNPMIVVMLNPSKADGEIDDPTVKVLMSYAFRLRRSGTIIGNLYALRSTNPHGLFSVRHAERVGPENDRQLHELLDTAAWADIPVICAWGAHELADSRAVLFRRWAADAKAKLHVLAFTKEGHPHHPLRLRFPPEPIEWGPP